MKKRSSGRTIILFLTITAILIAVVIAIGLIEGILLSFAVGLVVTAYLLKGGEKGELKGEDVKSGIEDDVEFRPTALGCYGSWSEEEKLGYSQRSSQNPQEGQSSRSQQKPPRQ